MRTPEEAYMADPLFRTVVDTLENLITEARLSPSEVREAAMLALIHHEQRNLRQPFFAPAPATETPGGET